MITTRTATAKQCEGAKGVQQGRHLTGKAGEGLTQGRMLGQG